MGGRHPTIIAQRVPVRRRPQENETGAQVPASTAAPGVSSVAAMSGYARVWAASTGSNLGDGVVAAALPLLAATYTSDPVLIGGLTAASALPWLFFSLVAGALVDRSDRRVVIVVVDTLRAAAVGGLGVVVLLGWDALAWVYGAAVALGIGETLSDTAAQTILPAVVAGEDLERANGRLFAAQIVANQFAGPPLGGALFALALPAPLFLDAATFLASAALLASLPGRFSAAGATRSRLGREVGEGLIFLWRDRVIRSFALGAAAINFASASTAALFVLYARDVLGLGPVGFGVLLGVGAVGSVGGSLASPRLTARWGRGTTLVASVAGIAVALAGIGLASSAAVVAAAFALFGFASDVWNVIAVSHRQRVVPDRLLGRLNAGYRLLAYGAFPVGGLCAGFAARAFGIRSPYLAGAGLVALLSVWFATRRAAVDSV